MRFHVAKLAARLKLAASPSVDSHALKILSRGYADAASLQKTSLHDFHVEHGGKMVPFSGWSMPIQYEDSIMASHLHCRARASLFDVSHMLGLTVKGKDAVPFLESLVVGDVAGIPEGSGSLSVFTNEQGGIIDDTVLTKISPEEIYFVVNAGNRDKDVTHIKKHMEVFKGKGGSVELEIHGDRGLLALQGRASMYVLQPLVKDADLTTLYFSQFTRADVKGIPCWVTRTGYTGEDGFEISCPSDKAVELAEVLLDGTCVRLAGLGARDSLRLEAGLCLYGNDLTDDISPVQAGLTWTIGKNRREKCDFVGGEVIKKQLADGVDVRRVGLVSLGAPARQHSEIYNAKGEQVGEVTSGAYSPTLKRNVAMGYVKKGNNKVGTELEVAVRGKRNAAEVTKMPFVEVSYYRPRGSK